MKQNKNNLTSFHDWLDSELQDPEFCLVYLRTAANVDDDMFITALNDIIRTHGGFDNLQKNIAIDASTIEAVVSGVDRIDREALMQILRGVDIISETTEEVLLKKPA